MSDDTGAPLFLPLLAPSQAQPEVPVNAAFTAVNDWAATHGGGGSDASDSGGGVPAGGTTGQVLGKASDADFDTEWVDQTGGGGSGGGGGTAPLTPYDYPASPTAYDDEFDGAHGSTIDAKWTQRNQSTSTKTISGDGSLVITDAATGAASEWTLFTETAPSPPYTMQACLAHGNPNGTANSFIGIVALNVSSSKFYAFGPAASLGSHPVFHFTGISSASGAADYNSENGSTLGADLFSFCFFRIENDGTNLKFSGSRTGVTGTFKQLASIALSAFITSVDAVGIGMNIGYTSQIICSSFRRVA